MNWLLPLLTPIVHAAPEQTDGSPRMVGAMALVLGVVLVFFSGARAEQQSARLGLEAESDQTNGVKLVYQGLGVLCLIAGVLMVLGIFVPGHDGQPGYFAWP